MKSFHLLTIVAIFATLLFVPSCSPETTISGVDTALAPPSSYLKFEDRAGFEAFLQQMQLSEDQSSFVSGKFNGFKSYADLYNSFDWNTLEGNGTIKSIADYDEYPVSVLKVGSEFEIQPIVDANLLSYVVDENRMVQVGDSLYQVNRDEVLRVAAEGNDLTDLQMSPDADRFAIYRSESIGIQKAFASCSNLYTYRGDLHRLQGIWKEVQAYLYNEISIQTEHRKRGLLNNWYANKEKSIRVSHSTVIIDNGGVQEVFGPDSRTKYDASDCKITLHWSVLWFTGVNVESGSSSHSSQETGVNPSPSCNITVN